MSLDELAVGLAMRRRGVREAVRLQHPSRPGSLGTLRMRSLKQQPHPEVRAKPSLEGCSSR